MVRDNNDKKNTYDLYSTFKDHKFIFDNLDNIINSNFAHQKTS